MADARILDPGYWILILDRGAQGRCVGGKILDIGYWMKCTDFGFQIVTSTVKIEYPLIITARWPVHEKRGPVGNVRWVRLARVDRSFFVLPFLLLLFFGQAKKSKSKSAHSNEPDKPH